MPHTRLGELSLVGNGIVVGVGLARFNSWSCADACHTSFCELVKWGPSFLRRRLSRFEFGKHMYELT